MSVEEFLVSLALLGLIIFFAMRSPLSRQLVIVAVIVLGLLYSNKTIPPLLLGMVLAFLMNPAVSRVFFPPPTPASDPNAARTTPMSAEGFQARDPLSIQKRIHSAAQPAPLAPKVANVTGVLESADILDNVPLKPMQELTSDAVPGASIPASAKASVAIYAPAEDLIPVEKSKDKAPKMNPFLHNGEDHEGVATALIAKGTDGAADVMAGDLAGLESVASPAF